MYLIEFYYTQICFFSFLMANEVMKLMALRIPYLQSSWIK